jgi:hypothetical protein
MNIEGLESSFVGKISENRVVIGEKMHLILPILHGCRFIVYRLKNTNELQQWSCTALSYDKTIRFFWLIRVKYFGFNCAKYETYFNAPNQIRLDWLGFSERFGIAMPQLLDGEDKILNKVILVMLRWNQYNFVSLNWKNLTFSDGRWIFSHIYGYPLGARTIIMSPMTIWTDVS